MSTFQARKGSLLDASRTQTNHSTILNTTDISLNSTNLESYKKALHSIVRRLNKTPSSSSKTTIKKLEYKMNQTQQPLYTTNILTSSQSSKKYYMSPTSATKNHSIANRSQSGERSPYKVLKEGGDRSMQESYLRKESLTSNFMNSVSITKGDKQENTMTMTMTEELYDDKLGKGDSVFVQDNALNSTLLQDVNGSKVETEGDQRLRELVHKYQLRDSAYRQELNQMKKAHETMKSQMNDLEKEVDKANKNRDMEKRYIMKLEEENNQLKEKLQKETAEKMSLTVLMAENKENQYLKMIEDLKTQVSTLTSEKKLIEHLLKNSLMHKEETSNAPVAVPLVSKENIKDERKQSAGILTTLESSSLAINSCKYSNIKERVKTAPYSKKSMVTEPCNDENDYSTHAHYQTMNASFATMPLKDAMGLKEVKQPQQQQSNLSFNFGKPVQFLNERINTQADEVGESMDYGEGDEAFPNKVFHPKLNQKSLKERMNMSQFKLDLTRISKNRKAD